MEDNDLHEIPLVNRRIIELDIENIIKNNGNSNLTKEISIKVAAFNTIKSIIDEQDLFASTDFLKKYHQQSGLKYFIELIEEILAKPTTDAKRENFKQFFLNILLNNSLNDKMWTIGFNSIEKLNLYSIDELNRIKLERNKYCNISLPTIITMNDWKMCDTKGNLIYKK